MIGWGLFLCAAFMASVFRVQRNELKKEVKNLIHANEVLNEELSILTKGRR